MKFFQKYQYSDVIAPIISGNISIVEKLLIYCFSENELFLKCEMWLIIMTGGNTNTVKVPRQVQIYTT